VLVPDADEPVALGAAAQATACLFGEAPEEAARRWNARAGRTIEPPPERDLETLERIRTVLRETLPLHRG
jgi:xylulokinase